MRIEQLAPSVDRAIRRHKQRIYTIADLRNFSSEIHLRMTTVGSVFSSDEFERLDDLRGELLALAVAIEMEN